MERAGASAPIETESEPRSFVETRADVRNGSSASFDSSGADFSFAPGSRYSLAPYQLSNGKNADMYGGIAVESSRHAEHVRRLAFRLGVVGAFDAIAPLSLGTI